MRRTISLIAALAALLFSLPQASAVTIDTVPVGNAGNAPDELSTSNNPGNLLFGAVAYEYRIGKFEVTLGQYAEFLNAVAGIDPYGLYDTGMAPTPLIAGIARSGVSGSYIYGVTGTPNKPATFVSWGDAARFANWLHNGQPTGLQNGSTTEDGAYTLNGATTNAALNAATRNPGAKWFIPSESEWYKAAYHKNDGLTGNYWNYPTSADAFPYSDQPPGDDAPTPSNTANLKINDGFANGYNDGFAVTGATTFNSFLDYRTDVGAYTFTMSPYGTFDQAGNAIEWTEGLIIDGDVPGTFRNFRGGQWFSNISLAASGRGNSNPADGGTVTGFRLATIVPEPSSFALCLFGALGAYFLARRRRHN